MALQIFMREKRNVAILDLSGDLLAPECNTLPSQVRELLAAGKKKIAINLKKVRRTDSFGLGSLAASFVSAQRQEAVVKLFSPNQLVGEALQSTRLDTVIGTYSGEKDALTSFD